MTTKPTSTQIREHAEQAMRRFGYAPPQPGVLSYEQRLRVWNERWEKQLHNATRPARAGAAPNETSWDPSGYPPEDRCTCVTRWSQPQFGHQRAAAILASSATTSPLQRFPVQDGFAHLDKPATSSIFAEPPMAHNAPE